MASVTKSIDVNVPVSAAYNQWTQFDLFPQFMDGVKEVRQLDDKRCIGAPRSAAKSRSGTPHHRAASRPAYCLD